MIMKATIIERLAVLIIVGLGMLLVTPQLSAQDEKYKPRLSIEYQKTMGEKAHLLINAKYKGEDGYSPATNLKVNVYQQILEDSLMLVGEITTNNEGNAPFILESTSTKPSDTVLRYEYVVKVEISDRFKKAKKSVKFMDSFLSAEVIEEDSIHYIQAQLLDGAGDPIEGEDLTVQVQRLFAPLTIGESSYETDDQGKIRVALEDPVPSYDGSITFEVVLDARKYGIVKSILGTNIGKNMEDLSTFDKRTMWSATGKTPIFLLVLANVIIFGIFTVILILIRNLYKISKS